MTRGSSLEARDPGKYKSIPIGKDVPLVWRKVYDRHPLSKLSRLHRRSKIGSRKTSYACSSCWDRMMDSCVSEFSRQQKNQSEVIRDHNSNKI